MTLQYPKNYIVFDFETTGFESGKDSILEIAAMKVYPGGSSALQCVVKCTVPPKITQLTGITQEHVDTHGMDIKAALEAFISFIGNAPLVGHNIVRFDLKFLENSIFKHLEWKMGDIQEYMGQIKNNCIDTAALFKGMLMGQEQQYNQRHIDFAYRILEGAPVKGVKFNLADACKHFKIEVKEQHRALADVELTNQLYKALCVPETVNV